MLAKRLAVSGSGQPVHQGAERLPENPTRRHNLELLGRLTGGVAHDINNLLTAILLNSDVLAARVDDRTLSAVAEATRMSAERAGDLTKRLLGLVRDPASLARPTDINAAIRELAPLLRRTIGEHMGLEVTLEAKSPLACVDPTRLETALLNLAINARDAMPQGGRLTIRTTNDPVCGRGAKAGWLTIAVIDEGDGMAPDVAARATEPFFTTKPCGRGTGLGLSLVRSFAADAGGTIAIDSKPGVGTMVSLKLPIAPHSAKPQPVEVVARARLTGSESILLVEDDRIVRAHVETALIDLGYRVESVADAGQALIARPKHARVDLLFTDIVMPGRIGGRELAKRLRARFPSLRVLYTSGYAPPAGLARDPACAFLAKPFRRRDLGLAVRSLLDRAAA